jgi:hypothetical protein
MEKRRKSRYLLAVYLVVAGIAIITALVGINYCQGSLQSVLLSLSTELLGVVLIFFLVNRLFLLEDWNVSERIDRLIAILKPAPDAEAILKDRRASADLAERASQAKEIWVCGYSLIALTNTCEGFFVRRLADGCDLRFLLLDPECDATHMLDGLITPRPGELAGDIRSVLARLGRVRTSASSPTRGQLEIRLLQRAPTFSLIAVDPGQPSGWVHVEPYPSYHGVPLDVGRPHFVLTESRGRWYRFFCDQFQRLWNDPGYSRPYAV